MHSSSTPNTHLSSILNNMPALEAALSNAMSDIMLFDNVPEQQIIILGEIAKAIVAIKTNSLFKSRNALICKTHREIVAFIDEQIKVMHDLAGTLIELGEIDLFNSANTIGKLLYADDWIVPVSDVDKMLAERDNQNKNIVLYKAKNGELTIRFKDKETRDAFLAKFTIATIPEKFRNGPQYDNNKAGKTPVTYSGQDNRIFFPSYKAIYGEFGVNCGNSDNRNTLIQSLGIKQTSNDVGAGRKTYENGFCDIYSHSAQENAIYFNSKSPIFVTPGVFLTINTETGEVTQSKIKDFDQILSVNVRARERKGRATDDLERNDTVANTTADIAPAYSFTCSTETQEKIKQYKTDILNKKIMPGVFLAKSLQNKDIHSMTTEKFIECLLATKPDRIFAEGTIFNANTNWNGVEIALLGDISCIIPTKAHDQGEHQNPTPHKTPIDVTLIYVPGPLLQIASLQSEKPDYLEICPNKSFNSNAYYAMIERRLLPGLLQVNQTAEANNRHLFVTVPGLGCGLFSGEFGNIIHKEFELALKRLLETHGNKLNHIKAIWYDNYNKEPLNYGTINGVKFFVTTLTKGGLPQLCEPKKYGEEFADCDLVSIVAWDHVSKPGNDYWGGARQTDDGVKAAATDTMPVLTGISGVYLKDRLVPADQPTSTWTERTQGNTVLCVNNNVTHHETRMPLVHTAAAAPMTTFAPSSASSSSNSAHAGHYDNKACQLFVTLNSEQQPELRIVFANEMQRDKWHQAFLIKAQLIGVNIAGSSLIKTLPNNPYTLRVLAAPHLNDVGMTVFKEPGIFQFFAAEQLKLNLGNAQLLNFFMQSLNLTGQHGSLTSHGSAFLFDTTMFKKDGAYKNTSVSTIVNESVVDEVLASHYGFNLPTHTY